MDGDQRGPDQDTEVMQRQERTSECRASYHKTNPAAETSFPRDFIVHPLPVSFWSPLSGRTSRRLLVCTLRFHGQTLLVSPQPDPPTQESHQREDEEHCANARPHAVDCITQQIAANAIEHGPPKDSERIPEQEDGPLHGASTRQEADPEPQRWHKMSEADDPASIAPKDPLPQGEPTFQEPRQAMGPAQHTAVNRSTPQ